MTQIIWSDDLSVGHAEIDRQHKKWIDIFNTAHDKMMNKNIENLSGIAIEAVNEMHRYAETHFAFEEAYMEEIGYPEISKHKLQHAIFTSHLKRIHDDINKGKHPLNSEIMKIIENWFVNHIRSEDQKIK